VLAFSDIIDFLLGLLRDDAARAQFERDPQKTLADSGLQGVSAQDIRDARLQLADSGAVSAVDDGAHSPYPHGHDPVREIGYTTAHYAATDDPAGHEPADDTGPGDPAPQNNTFLTIDDRDTLFFQSISDDDITVTDNSVNVTDSFNQDNSTVTAIQANGSFNSDDDTTIDAQNSFNSDDDVVAIQDNDVNGGGDPIVVDTAATTTAVDAAPDPDPAPPVDPPVDPPEEAAPEVDAPVDDVPVEDTTDIADTASV
jgi:hypothetical protein